MRLFYAANHDSTAGSWVLGIVMTVGGLLIMVASFHLIIKMAGLVDALAEKIKEMKL